MFAWRRSWPDGLNVGFSNRLGGVTPGTMGELNLGRTDVEPTERVAENFQRFGDAAGISRFVVVHQVHGADVLLADDAFLTEWPDGGHLGTEAGRPPLPVADAVVSTRVASGVGTALVVRVADCLPVVLADTIHRVIAVAHAGRVGLLAGVLPATVTAMREQGAERINAWIGPHVCGRCYEVPEEMAADARRHLPGTRATTSWGTPAVDLAGGAVEQLADLGVSTSDIGMCTLEDDTLHSHRRDASAAGRAVGAVWFGNPGDAPG